MPPEIVALLNNPAFLLALLLAGAAGMALERFDSKTRRTAWRQRYGWKPYRPRETGGTAPGPSSPPSRGAASKPIDATDQLRIVLGAAFTAQPLLNRGELRVFRELDRIVLGLRPDWQVMAQVSLGEILASPDTEAYRCINTKRVDLLLVDENCRPRHAIEYQGGAHHQGTAAARDAVKKEALRRAGIGYHEVVAGHTTPGDLKRLVEKLLGKPEPSPVLEAEGKPSSCPSSRGGARPGPLDGMAENPRPAGPSHLGPATV